MWLYFSSLRTKTTSCCIWTLTPTCWGPQTTTLTCSTFKLLAARDGAEEAADPATSKGATCGQKHTEVFCGVLVSQVRTEPGWPAVFPWPRVCFAFPTTSAPGDITIMPSSSSSTGQIKADSVPSWTPASLGSPGRKWLFPADV